MARHGKARQRHVFNGTAIHDTAAHGLWISGLLEGTFVVRFDLCLGVLFNLLPPPLRPLGATTLTTPPETSLWTRPWTTSMTLEYLVCRAQTAASTSYKTL